uniref:CCHC-type domain-containing protein n=1 Tax=Alexandrium catenella TaxID=2925 RepID=A0A7S1QHH1_ALECA
MWRDFDDFSDDGFISDDSLRGIGRFGGRSGGRFGGGSGGGLKCFECGGPHRKANCPNIRCFSCHGLGHMARECPQGRTLAPLFGRLPVARATSSASSLLQALAGLSLGGAASARPADEHGFPKDLKLFHGTTMSSARNIEREGFKVSAAGQLGPGVYLVGESNIDKAKRFAHDYALRDDQRRVEAVQSGSEPALVECIVHISNPKFLSGNDQAGSWKLQGYDAARSDSTAVSSSSEWCLKDPGMVKRIVRIVSLAAETCPWKNKAQLCPYTASALQCPCKGARGLF